MFKQICFLALLCLAISCSKQENQNQTDRLISKHEPYEQFFLQRAYPDAKIDFSAYEKGLFQARELAAEKATGFDDEWTIQGPGNLGARINTIAAHPTDSNIIYVGFARGGVWKTTDGGANWAPIFDDQLYLAIGDIEIDKNDPNTIYVGTGDPNISGYPFIGGGVFKSTDAGETWTNIGLTDTRITSRILTDPTDPERLYVGTMGIPFEPTNDKGLYRSLDGGLTWEQSLFVSDTAGIIDIVINPENPNVLYAASWNRIRNNQQSSVRGPDAKIWKTTDGGDTWTALEGGLPISEDMGRIGLTMSAQDPEKLYAMYVGEGNQLSGIYRTIDAGENWTEIPTSGEFDGNTDLKDFALGGFGWYFGKIRVSALDDNIIFLCGVDLWRGVVSGNEAEWSAATPPWFFYDVHADKHDLVYTPEGNILLATDGGLYQSNDDAETWQDIENIPTSQFYRVAYNPHAPDNYYGGMQDNGSSGGNADNINEWPRLFGGDGFQMAFHPTDPNISYVETQRGNIYISANGGQFYNNAIDGIDEADRKNWDMPYMLSRHDPSILYTGTYRAYQGQQSGDFVFWNSTSSDFTDGNIFGSAFHTISTLDESHFTQGRLYYGTTDGNVWRIEPNGTTTNVTLGLPDRYVTDLKCSPSNENTVYVSHSGYKDNEFIPRLHRSDDAGANWTNISGDLPDLAINDIYILPENQDTVLFVATDGGVYGSLNAGQNWERMGTNMPFVPVYDLDLNVAHNELIAGTFARSIMTYSIDSLLFMEQVEPPDTMTTVALNDILQAQQSIKLYPSPAANVVTAEFGITEPGRAYEMVILDSAGRLVFQEKNKTTTLESKQINVNDWASGTYFVKVKFRHTILTGTFVKG